MESIKPFTSSDIWEGTSSLEEEPKNKAAQELAAKRWEKTTKDERSLTLQHISNLGWTEEQRAKRLPNSGRPLSPDRCPCGKMTKDRAEKRRHKCQSI